jgi:anti-sigma factor RsiW
MVADMHPHDIELFEYVEDELPQGRRKEIAAHLATCSVCASQVELATAGRHALHGTELLELPDARRAEIMRSLPAREVERAPGERRAFSPRLVFAVLAGVLLLAAMVGILVSSNGNGSGSESSAGGAAADTADGGAAEAVQSPTRLSASGPAAAVAEDLRQKGFDAAVQEDRVIVHGATRRQVREALADRAPGDVEVVVKNP